MSALLKIGPSPGAMSRALMLLTEGIAGTVLVAMSSLVV